MPNQEELAGYCNNKVSNTPQIYPPNPQSYRPTSKKASPSLPEAMTPDGKESKSDIMIAQSNRNGWTYRSGGKEESWCKY